MFLIFAGENYYPEGGWNDFVGVVGTLEEAKHRITSSIQESQSKNCRIGFDWMHIVSLEGMNIVASAHSGNSFEIMDLKK